MSMRGIINLETYVKREAAAEGASRLDYTGGIAVNWGVNKGRHVCRGPRDRRLGHCSGLLPALKGEGSLRAAHWFAACRPHLHHLTAGGRICAHPAPLVQRQAAGRAFSPLPLPLAGSRPPPLPQLPGTRGYVGPYWGIPLRGHYLFCDAFKCSGVLCLTTPLEGAGPASRFVIGDVSAKRLEPSAGKE